jgi:hypothetical protein
VIVGAFLGWVTLRSGSVWPAVIGHASINGISGLPLLFVQGQPNSLLGPIPTGFIASLAWPLLAIGLLLSPTALAMPSEKDSLESSLNIICLKIESSNCSPTKHIKNLTTYQIASKST